MSWGIREAKLSDASEIVGLAWGYNEFLMPYVLNEFVVRNYIDQFMVAEDVVHNPSPHYEVGGAVHYIDSSTIPKDVSEIGPKLDKILCFLLHIKQVPLDITHQFIKANFNTAFLCQIVCPGKGSFYAILEELKSRYDELWCWMSEVGPSYESYVRYGFNFVERRPFWNVYKCDYSTFALCKWKKEG